MKITSQRRFIVSGVIALLAIAAPSFAQDADEAEKIAQQTDATAPASTPENPGRFAPDFCDFEITFPEKPQVVRKCMAENECFEVNSYTMVYDLQTTVDVTANCTPSTPGNYKRYSEGVMKAALAGMVEDRNLTEHEIKFTDEKDGTKSAGITGVGVTGSTNKIYTGQLWIGPNSVFTVQAELVGSEHPQGDKVFSDILASIKTKPGKQLPPKPKAANVPKVNGNN